MRGNRDGDPSLSVAGDGGAGGAPGGSTTATVPLPQQTAHERGR